MNNIMKKIAISTMAIAMAGLMTASNAYADETVKPIAPVEGEVLYRYSMDDSDSQKKHNGIDILYEGTTFISTPISGEVVISGPDSMGDYVVITDTEKGDSILISNLRASFVKEGDKLKAGDEIGVADGDYIHVTYYPEGFMHRDVTNDPTAFLTMNGTKLNFDKVNNK